jgi:hypothetical protein
MCPEVLPSLPFMSSSPIKNFYRFSPLSLLTHQAHYAFHVLLRKSSQLTSNIEVTMNRKFVARVVSFVALILGASSFGFAQSNSPACNAKLIAGNYGFTLTGTKLAGNGPTGQQVGVAMTQFDGVGTLTQIDTVTVAGTVVADFTHTPATGTYTVNSDCTGTFTINFTDGRPPVTVNFVVVDNGAEIDTVVISAGGEQGIIASGSIGKRRSSRY